MIAKGYIWSIEPWRGDALLLQIGPQRRRIILPRRAEGFSEEDFAFRPGFWAGVRGEPYGGGMIYAIQIRIQERLLTRKDVFRSPPLKRVLRQFGLASGFPGKRYGNLWEYVLSAQHWRDAMGFRKRRLSPEQAFTLEFLVRRAVAGSDVIVIPPPGILAKLAVSRDGFGLSVDEFRERVKRLCWPREIVDHFWNFFLERAQIVIVNDDVVKPVWIIKIESELRDKLKQLRKDLEEKRENFIGIADPDLFEKIRSISNPRDPDLKFLPWVSVVTGPAGSGKTTFVRHLAHVLEKAGFMVDLTSARGGAAVRLGPGGETIHYATWGFKRRVAEAVDIVIVDEAQELNLLELRKLLLHRVTNPHQWLIFVGDPDQARRKNNALNLLLEYLPDWAVKRMQKVHRFNFRNRRNLAVIVQNWAEAVLIVCAWACRIIDKEGLEVLLRDSMILAPHLGRHGENVAQGKLGAVQLSLCLNRLLNGFWPFRRTRDFMQTIFVTKSNARLVNLDRYGVSWERSWMLVPTGSCLVVEKDGPGVLYRAGADERPVLLPPELVEGLLRYARLGPVRTIQSAHGTECKRSITVVPEEGVRDRSDHEALLVEAHTRARESSIFVILNNLRETQDWLRSQGYEVRPADLGRAKRTVGQFIKRHPSGVLRLLFNQRREVCGNVS